MNPESIVVQFLACVGAFVLVLVVGVSIQIGLNGIMSIWRGRRDEAMIRYLYTLRDEAQTHQSLDEKGAVIALIDEVITQAESSWGNEDIIDRFAIMSKRQRREAEVARQYAKGAT